MGRREEVLELAKKIAAAEEELARLRARFDELVPESLPSAPPQPLAAPQRRRGRPPSAGMAVADRIKAALAAEPEREFDYPALRAALPSVEINTMRSTMQRLVTSGEVASPEKGKFKAKQ